MPNIPRFALKLLMLTVLIAIAVLCIATVPLIFLRKPLQAASNSVSDVTDLSTGISTADCFESFPASLSYTDSGWLLSTDLHVIRPNIAISTTDFAAAWDIADVFPTASVSSIRTRVVNLYLDLDSSLLIAKDEGQSDDEKVFWETTFYLNTLKPALFGDIQSPEMVNLSVRCNCACDDTVSPGVEWNLPQGTAAIQSALECISVNDSMVEGANTATAIPLATTESVADSTWVVLRGDPNDKPIFDQAMTMPDIQKLAKAVAYRYEGLPKQDNIVVIMVSRNSELRGEPLRDQEKRLNEAVKNLMGTRQIRVFLFPMRGNALANSSESIKQELVLPAYLHSSVLLPKLLTTSQVTETANLRLLYPGCNDLPLIIPTAVPSKVPAKASPILLMLLALLLAASGLAISLLLYRYNVINLRVNLNDLFYFPWNRD